MFEKQEHVTHLFSEYYFPLWRRLLIALCHKYRTLMKYENRAEWPIKKTRDGEMRRQMNV
jgi:hypothetical protein